MAETFNQAFVWETYNDLLKAAAIIGKNDRFLELVKDQITKLDPIIIGASGQLKERTLPDLWTVHPPFQIDANLGLVAGVAEMLLQSHEGFIELLPALPDAWKTGRFDGLVARGNFEISAQWIDKKVNTITINAKSGGVCRIKIPNLKSINLKNDKGMAIDYKIVDKDIVEFSTLAGSAYHFSEIKLK